jgi:hypothetical protein
LPETVFSLDSLPDVESLGGLRWSFLEVELIAVDCQEFSVKPLMEKRRAWRQVAVSGSGEGSGLVGCRIRDWNYWGLSALLG